MFPDERKVILKKEASEKILRGVNLLADAVSVTLGPNGRNVILERVYNKSRVTKDGVSVAREIFVTDRLENVAIGIAKEAAQKTVEEAGDGTTTATIIMRELTNKLIEKKEKHNIIRLKKGVERALTNIEKELKKWTYPILNEDILVNIATISVNNDRELGEIIGKTVYNLSSDSKVFIEESKTEDTSVEVINGISIEHGFISPYFIRSDTETMELEDPLVLVTNAKIKYIEQIYPIVNLAFKNKKDLLIIAEDLEKEALTFVLKNLESQKIKIAVVRPPGISNMRLFMLQDIGIQLGCKPILKDTGGKIEHFKEEHIGRCEKVIVTKRDTVIINPVNAKSPETEKRINLIKKQIKEAEKGVDERHEERLAKIFSGVAKIYVGGKTEIEIKEKKDRVEDAVLATQAAVQEGVLVGGGIALKKIGIKLLQSLDKKIIKYKENSIKKEELLGEALLYLSIQKPFDILLCNSGMEEEEVNNLINLKLNNKKLCIDFKEEKWVHGIKKGIIDPVKVTKCALKNAVSTAILLSTTDAVIHYVENIFNNAHIANPDYTA